MNKKPLEKGLLSLNCGSSTLKFGVFTAHGTAVQELASGAIEGIGQSKGRAWLRCHEGTKHPPAPGDAFAIERELSHDDHRSAIATTFAWLSAAKLPDIAQVGHRFVHGGRHFTGPVRIDTAVAATLRDLVPLAPLHMPAAIAGVEAVFDRLPTALQVGCFDTAFHATMPELARRLPIPAYLHEEGVQRYGFHGLSYEYVMSAIGADPPARIVIAHLGHGSSLVAVRDGQAIDTTMGFSPCSGVPMATRSGDLDPGVLIYLLREKRMSIDALASLVDRNCGLLALGGTSDMRELLARAPVDPGAQLALDIFAYALRKAIGSLTAALGGIDLLVFTGGIGENAAAVRELACKDLESLGIQVDHQRNHYPTPDIHADESRCKIRVIPTREDLVIARHVAALNIAGS